MQNEGFKTNIVSAITNRPPDLKIFKMKHLNVKPDKTKHFFHQMCKLVYLCGGPNFWYNDLAIHSFVVKIHDHLTKAVDLLVFIFFVMGWAAFYKQEHLTEKQTSDLILFSYSQPILYTFIYALKYYNKNVKYVFRKLAGKLKDVYNDSAAEDQMIRKAKFYSVLFAVLSFSTILFYGIDGALQATTTEATFTSVITVWPDVEDKSVAAKIGRIVFYIIWWLYMIRLTSVYMIVIPMTVCLSHQYINLSSYFSSLNDIFENEDRNQKEKESDYEEAFITGIKLHLETLICTKECQKICSWVYGGQIIINVTVLAMLMLQMMNSDKTLANTIAIVTLATDFLVTTGCLMWNGGDVTIEATKLATAIYLSGWQHCQKGAGERIRPLIVVAMARCQVPVELRCLGIVKISYETYLSIVKSTYSIFSVLY